MFLGGWKRNSLKLVKIYKVEFSEFSDFFLKKIFQLSEKVKKHLAQLQSIK